MKTNVYEFMATLRLIFIVLKYCIHNSTYEWKICQYYNCALISLFRSPGGTPIINKSRKRSCNNNLTSVMYSALQEKFAVSTWFHSLFNFGMVFFFCLKHCWLRENLLAVKQNMNMKAPNIGGIIKISVGY